MTAVGQVHLSFLSERLLLITATTHDDEDCLLLNGLATGPFRMTFMYDVVRFFLSHPSVDLVTKMFWAIWLASAVDVYGPPK
jgi:hypothetical protein